MKAECKLLMLFSWLIACTHCSVRALSYLLTAMNCIVYKQLELEDFFLVSISSKTFLFLFVIHFFLSFIWFCARVEVRRENLSKEQIM